MDWSSFWTWTAQAVVAGAVFVTAVLVVAAAVVAFTERNGR